MFIFLFRGCDMEGYRVKHCCQKEITKPDMFVAELRKKKIKKSSLRLDLLLPACPAAAERRQISNILSILASLR